MTTSLVKSGSVKLRRNKNESKKEEVQTSRATSLSSGVWEGHGAVQRGTPKNSQEIKKSGKENELVQMVKRQKKGDASVGTGPSLGELGMERGS